MFYFVSRKTHEDHIVLMCELGLDFDHLRLLSESFCPGGSTHAGQTVRHPHPDS